MTAGARTDLAALTLTALSVSACALGPNYARPTITPPPAFRGVLHAGRGRRPRRPRRGSPVSGARARGARSRPRSPRTSTCDRPSPGSPRPARAPMPPGPTSARRCRAGSAASRARGCNADETWLRTIYSLGVAFQWEIDFFGRLRRASEAARNDLLATEDGARAVMSSLVGDVAQAWFESQGPRRAHRHHRAQHPAAAGRAAPGAAARAGRRRRRPRRTAGHEPAGADARAAADAAAGAAARREPPERSARASAWSHRPDTGPDYGGAAGRFRPGCRRSCSSGAPTSGRPNASSMAATSRIGVAMGNAFPFPRIGLTAFFGLMSGSLDSLFRGDDSGVVSWSPSIGIPLIDSGRGKAGVAVAVAQTEQAAIFYRSSILVALTRSGRHAGVARKGARAHRAAAGRGDGGARGAAVERHPLRRRRRRLPGSAGHPARAVCRRRPISPAAARASCRRRCSCTGRSAAAGRIRSCSR